MFKLKKIINSGVNVPEPERISITPGITPKAGTGLVMVDGTLTVGNYATAPTHITLADVNSGDRYALCYKVYPNMLFEAPISTAEPEYLYEGMIVCLTVDKNGATGLTDNTDGVATICDLNGVSKDGDTVLVRFE